MYTISDQDHATLSYIADDSSTRELAEVILATKFEDRSKLSFTDLETLAAGILWQQRELDKIAKRAEEVPLRKKFRIRRPNKS